MQPGRRVPACASGTFTLTFPGHAAQTANRPSQRMEKLISVTPDSEVVGSQAAGPHTTSRGHDRLVLPKLVPLCGPWLSLVSCEQ